MSADSVELGRVFRRGFAATLGLDLVTKVLAAASVIVLVRGLSVSHYAYTTLFLTFAQFAGGAATGGVRTRYLREEAERISRASTAKREGAFAAAFLKSTILLLVAGAIAVPVAELVGLGQEFGGGTYLVVFSTLFAVGFAATELTMAHYQAQKRFFTAGILSVVRGAALVVASLMIVVTSETYASIGLWFVAAMLGVGVATAAPMAHASLSNVRGAFRLARFDREESWLSLYYVAAAGFAYVDVMVAAALLDQKQVATLGAALRYLGIVLGAIPALGAILRVRTAQVDLVDSVDNQRAMVLTWFRRTTLPAAVLVAIAALLSPFLIPLIDGGKYPGSIVVFQILLATAFCAYVLAPSVSILMAQRRYLVLAAVYGLGLLVNLVGDIAIARTFGVTGIAVVSASVYVAIDITLIAMGLSYGQRRGGLSTNA